MKTNTQQALALLKAGNDRFVSGALTPTDDYALLRGKLSEGQHPFAVVLCCSDSRVAPEIIFDQKLGDLFVIRNAGNVIDKHVLGSIEYAVEHLGTSLVVVMGHSCCGAVTATHLGETLPDNIMAIARRIRPSINTTDGIDDNARRHAARMARWIQRDPLVKHLNTLVVSAFYDLESGKVEWL
ncbi:MAG: carbonic anhydrase [Bacteroidales bacterium]|nr:carbonic anhydrase [Bacteroidales bacterium]